MCVAGIRPPGWVPFGPLAIWPRRRLVRLDAGRSARLIALTEVETALLLALADADGAPVTRSALAAVVVPRRTWRSGSRAVDTHIWSLRRKLGDDGRRPRLIVTVAGIGYAITTSDGWRRARVSNG